jgi:hypothetical protein
MAYNPQAGGFTVANSQFGFTVTGATNMLVVVEAATNLSGQDGSEHVQS